MKRKDWPNLQRMFIALILLIISPLVGIAAGAVFWRSLERGLLVFNLLGLLGFALVTRPYWTGNRPRIRKLLMSGFAMGVSALLDIVTGRPVPLAVYFSSMVECFSLIPWITEILNEIHQGQWRSPPPARRRRLRMPIEAKRPPPTFGTPLRRNAPFRGGRPLKEHPPRSEPGRSCPPPASPGGSFCRQLRRLSCSSGCSFGARLLKPRRKSPSETPSAPLKYGTAQA